MISAMVKRSVVLSALALVANRSFAAAAAAAECKDAVDLYHQQAGDKELDVKGDLPVKIVSQHGSTVTFLVEQSWTSSQVDEIFVRYAVGATHESECSGVEQVPAGSALELTATCIHMTKEAVIDVWVVEAGFSGSNVPLCCDNAEPVGSKYTFILDCKPSCEVVEAETSSPTPALRSPTKAPTALPTGQPTAAPTASPTKRPTGSPTKNPTASPTKDPTAPPTKNPTSSPTKNPTAPPTKNPTASPTKRPTSSPTKNPTASPTKRPTGSPTKNPTASPTKQPTGSPTKNPTASPTKRPTASPTNSPVATPTGGYGGPASGFRTQTQGGWGQDCKNLKSGNPGCYRARNFDGCFPNGLTIGGSNNFLKFTNNQAVENYLPAGGPSYPITGKYTNPSPSDYNTNAAGQVTTISITLIFDRCIEDFGSASGFLGDQILCKSADPACIGATISSLLDVANKIMNGDGSGTLSNGNTITSATTIASCIDVVNNNYVDGTKNAGNVCTPN